MMERESIDEVIDKQGSKRLRAKKEVVKASIMEVLNETDIFELKTYLENVNRLEEQIK